MENHMKTFSIIASTVALVSCGGANVPSASYNQPQTAIYSPLLGEARGSYNGQAFHQYRDYLGDVKTCLWDVSVSIDAGSDYLAANYVSFSIVTELIEGSYDCASLNTHGDVRGIAGVDEYNPQYPILIDLHSKQQLDFTLKYTDNSFLMDGNGNLSYSLDGATYDAHAVLVKYSDLPNQIDNGIWQ